MFIYTIYNIKIASKEALEEAIFETHLRKVQLYIRYESRTFLFVIKKASNEALKHYGSLF